MNELTREEYVVHQVSETDDFDGVARIGMAHRDTSAVVQVFVRDMQAGWWDDHLVPYLVFCSGARPSDDEALGIVQRAVRTRDVRIDASLEPDRSFEPVTCASVEVPLVDPDSFEEMASHGMRWGTWYPNVSYRQDSEGAIMLLFYRDGEDVLPDDLDLDAALNLLK